MVARLMVDGRGNYVYVQAQGTAKPCMTTTLLERAAGKGQLSPDEDQLFEDVAGLSYSGKSRVHPLPEDVTRRLPNPTVSRH